MATQPVQLSTGKGRHSNRNFTTKIKLNQPDCERTGDQDGFASYVSKIKINNFDRKNIF